MSMELLYKAIDEAKKSPIHKQFFFYCIAVRNDGAEVHGTNHYSKSQRIPSHHAEARTIKKCDMGSIMYVARVLRDKKTIANARPCKFCQSLIKNKSIKKVYFTFSSTTYGIWVPEKDIWAEYNF